MRLPWLSETTDSATHNFARSGWRIPQLDPWELYRDPTRESAELIRIRTEALVSDMRAKRKASPQIRHLSNSLYNCVGHIFCSRRGHVDIRHIDEILRQDGYNEIMKEKCVAGDLVLYKFAGEPSHIGLISCVTLSADRVVRMSVLSKWGKDGEVEHDHDHVPMHCGLPTNYYSTMVNHAAR